MNERDLIEAMLGFINWMNWILLPAFVSRIERVVQFSRAQVSTTVKLIVEPPVEDKLVDLYMDSWLPEYKDEKILDQMIPHDLASWSPSRCGHDYQHLLVIAAQQVPNH